MECGGSWVEERLTLCAVFGWRLTGLLATVLRIRADDRLEVREVRRGRCVRRYLLADYQPPLPRYSHIPSSAAWPSTIDDFVEYARNRLAGGA